MHRLVVLARARGPDEPLAALGNPGRRKAFWRRARYPDAMLRLLLAAVLVACAPSPVAADLPPDVAPRDAAITEVDVRCDPEAARWTFETRTDGWTGGGRVWLSRDGDYVERHPLASVSAARDGSDDFLRLNLEIAAEWSEASAGSRTAFACRADDLAGILHVLSRDGARVTDCVAFGTAPERWARWNAENACATVWVPEEEATDTAQDSG